MCQSVQQVGLLLGHVGGRVLVPDGVPFLGGADLSEAERVHLLSQARRHRRTAGETVSATGIGTLIVSRKAPTMWKVLTAKKLSSCLLHNDDSSNQF